MEKWLVEVEFFNVPTGKWQTINALYDDFDTASQAMADAEKLFTQNLIDYYTKDYEWLEDDLPLITMRKVHIVDNNYFNRDLLKSLGIAPEDHPEDVITDVEQFNKEMNF